MRPDINVVKAFNRQMLVFLLTTSVIFIACQLDEKAMIEKGKIHNVFLGTVVLKDIEIKD